MTMEIGLLLSEMSAGFVKEFFINKNFMRIFTFFEWKLKNFIFYAEGLDVKKIKT